MKKSLTSDSSIDELTKWIEDDSKVCKKKDKQKLNDSLKEKKDFESRKNEERKKNKKGNLKIISDKYGKKNDPLYGKKGAERRNIINEYRKQYKQAELMKNKNKHSGTDGGADGMPSDEMIETMMKKIKASGQDPEEIMKKLNNPDYPEELKAEIVKDIFK